MATNSEGTAFSTNLGSLQEENQLLQQELNKVEDLLSTARAERDEIIIKYNALNDKVSLILVLLFKKKPIDKAYKKILLLSQITDTILFLSFFYMFLTRKSETKIDIFF